MNEKPRPDKYKTIVLTGSTGAFGRFLAVELLKYDDVKLILLVRGSSREEARERVRDIINIKSDRVEVFQSDLTKEHLGLQKSEYDELARRATHILHSAASTRFNLPLEEARIHNVITTERIVDFAKVCPNLIRFGFVSTALVAGKRSGIIREDEFEHSAGFSNSYQQTKYEAEALVRANADKLPIIIFRPPFIVTPVSSVSQKRQTSFLFILISLVAQERLPYVPGTEKSTMDIVDAVDTARVMVQLLIKENISHGTYQITNGVKALTVGELHRMIEEKWGKRIPVEYCGDMESFLQRISHISKHKPEVEAVYKRAESFLMEPAYPKIFDNTHTLSELNIAQIGEEPVDMLRLLFRDTLWNLSE